MDSENYEIKEELENLKSPQGNKKLKRMKSNPDKDYEVKVDAVNTFNPGPMEEIKDQSFDSDNMKSFDDNDEVKKTIE